MTEGTRMLREAGLRATQQRRAIVAILQRSAEHPSVDEIVAQVRDDDDTASVATVYRTLAALEGAGLIRKLTFEDAPARYEMEDGRDHDHLVDVETGELIEIPNDELVALRDRIAADLGYEIISQQTILRGRRVG